MSKSKITGNPYATTKSGQIKAPNKPAAGDPKSDKKVGGDLRSGKAGK